jgi:ADP-heptose:LPS heptosyltransferase
LRENPKILFVSLAFRGDLVLTFPAIRALKRKFPKATITLWVREFNVTLADLCPDIDNVESYDRFNSHGLGALREFIPKNIHKNTINRMKRTGYDIYIDDSGYTFTALVGSLLKIPLRIGRNQQGFGFLYHYDFPYDGDSQIIKRKFKLLEPLGITTSSDSDLRPVLAISNGSISIAQKNLPQFKNKKGYFVITPFTGWKAKNWDIDKYVFITNKFAEYSGLLPVFLGGPDDAILIDKMINLISVESINLAGKLTLAESSLIISGARIHIGGDTFSSHIAAATQIKSLSIFGPTNPSLSAFLTFDNIAVTKKISCAPKPDKIYCLKDAGRSCSHISCMRELKKEDVLAVLIDLWDGKIKSKVIEV